MSQLSDFLSENEFSPEQIITQSRVVESKTTEIRAAYAKRARARRVKKKYDEFEAPKPATLGRGLTPKTLNMALEGKSVSRIARQKITRAVNSLLRKAAKDEVEVLKLFADVPSRNAKKTASED